MKYVAEVILKTHTEEELKKKVTETVEKILINKAESDDE